MNHLESLKSALVGVLSEGSWVNIRADHDKAQLGWREDLNPGWGKPKYVGAVLQNLSDAEVVALGRRCLEAFPERSAIGVQNALWWIEANDIATVSQVTRLALADVLDGRCMNPREHPSDFMRRFAHPTEALPEIGYQADGSLYFERVDIYEALFGNFHSAPKQHRAPYTHRELLDCFNFLNWPDKRIFQFLESLVHPTVRQGDEQADLIELINGVIGADGWFLAETSRVSNRPVFTVQRRDRGVAGRPKNLIFASTGPKPELGFRDAINNDVVILKHAEHCLIYEDSIGDDGLLWDDLVAWWARMEAGDPQDQEVRKRVGKRLLAAVGSEPEKLFFSAYFKRFQPVLGGRLPALIPQVYLHYDPVTIRDLRTRGDHRRFQVQRMDFLLLLPHRVRVVVEIDGQQHYSDSAGGVSRPSPARYAETVKGDRDLRLAGYEMYRFGGHELHTAECAAVTVAEFFERLFRRHDLLT
jgi:hypothetical protein